MSRRHTAFVWLFLTLFALTGRVNAHYDYDALGRRVQATIGTLTTRYYYSGWQMIEERDGADVRVRYHVPGSQYIDEQVATYSAENGQWQYYLLGRQYNVIGRGNADGSTIEAVALDTTRGPALDTPGGPAAPERARVPGVSRAAALERVRVRVESRVASFTDTAEPD